MCQYVCIAHNLTTIQYILQFIYHSLEQIQKLFTRVDFLSILTIVFYCCWWEISPSSLILLAKSNSIFVLTQVISLFTIKNLCPIISFVQWESLNGMTPLLYYCLHQSKLHFDSELPHTLHNNYVSSIYYRDARHSICILYKQLRTIMY